MDEQTKSNIRDFLSARVSKCRILVVGDLMLDRYFFGEVTRISPEAPVPVTLIKKKKTALGGAANVAHNLARLGCRVEMIGVIGDDHHGRLLKNQLEKLDINHDGVILGRENTTTKARILGGHQQMLRVDFEESNPINADVEERILAVVKEKVIAGLDAIVLSDYHKGVCTESLCDSVIDIAHNAGVIVFADPKGNDWNRYRGVDYITPNVRETRDVIGRAVANADEDLRVAASEIRLNYSIPNVIITRSEKGMSLFLKNDEIHLPTVAQEVFDVSGAGDTVISVLALGISSGLSAYDSAVMANLAAGIGVGKVGTYAVSREEIIEALC